MRILAGDVGGTHCRLSVCEVNGTQVLRMVEDLQPSSTFASLAEIVREFLTQHKVEVRAACFGLPGPVSGRRATLTNLPWVVDADQLERDLGLPRVTLLNDLEANAHGLATLSSADFKVLREGTPDLSGNAGLVSPGTGLGQAGLHWVSGRFIPFATEGGHADFAPKTELEIELLRWLQARHGAHVSWERVVSGPGLANIYGFMRERDPGAEPSWLAAELNAGDAGVVITRHAVEQTSDLCQRALDLFMELFGAKAGNFALNALTTGGMYLGGGITPNLVGALPQSRFIERFDDKGRMRPLVEQVPLRVVLNDKAALQGAALFAARSANPGRG